jgi:hypothetical protein
MAIALRAPRRVRVGVVALAVLAVVFAVASTVQVIRIGDTGARAAWGSTHYAPQLRHKSDPESVADGRRGSAL